MDKIRDNLIKRQDIENTFKTQESIISRVHSTTEKLSEMNDMSIQKFRRAMQTYANAADIIRNMKDDLQFIHRAIKRLNEATDIEISQKEYQKTLEKTKNMDILSYGEKDSPFTHDIKFNAENASVSTKAEEKKIQENEQSKQLEGSQEGNENSGKNTVKNNES